MKKRILSLLLSAVMCIGVTGAYASVSEGADAPALKSGSRLLLDSENGSISRLTLGMTKAEVLDNLASADGASIKKDGAELAGGDAVTSGCVLTVGNASYTLAVNGDINGDGKINLSDVGALLKHVAMWDIDICEPAIDANLDSKGNLMDAALLMQYVAGWDVQVGAYDVTYSEEHVTAPNEDGTLALSVMDNMQKIDVIDEKIGDSATYRMRLAKNEIESCQIYLASDGGHEGLTVSFTQFGNGIGGTAETEMTMHRYFSVASAEHDWVPVEYPDALVPLSEFDIEDGYSQGFLLKIKADKDTEPGLYVSKVTVKNGDGQVVKVCNVYAEVWDITLPDESSCATAFGMGRLQIYAIHKQYEDDDGELYRNYYDFLLENRVSAYFLPYEFDDPRFEDYMNDPRVTSFTVDGCQSQRDPLTDDEIAELYEKYKDDENWNKKAYFYYEDEPGDMEKCTTIVEAAKRLERLFPGARHISPTGSNPWYGDVDQYEYLKDYLNLWCPVSHQFTPVDRWDPSHPSYGNGFNQESVDKYGTAEERFAALKERGDELWWYVCVGPEYPYANIAYINYEGERSRVLFWQQYMYDVDGLLFWDVNNWAGGDSITWRPNPTINFNGDGVLLYSGVSYGIYGPLGSLRLEYVRDGIEDFEYLKMAEALCGKEAVNEVLATVTTGILDFTLEAEVIEAAKDALAEMIMDAQAK